MPRKKVVKKPVKKSDKGSEKKQNLYERSKSFIKRNRTKLLTGTAGLVSAGTVLLLVNKYKKKCATPQEALNIASQETGVPVEKIEKVVTGYPFNYDKTNSVQQQEDEFHDAQEHFPEPRLSFMQENNRRIKSAMEGNGFGKVDRLKTLRKHLMVLKQI